MLAVWSPDAEKQTDLLLKVRLGDEDLFSVDDLLVALQASALLIDDLPHRQAAVFRHCQQELIVECDRHLRTQSLPTDFCSFVSLSYSG